MMLSTLFPARLSLLISDAAERSFSEIYFTMRQDVYFLFLVFLVFGGA
jgi:hypothetical protein